MSAEFEFDQAMRRHVSDRGRVHVGTREFCVSIDCTPPSPEFRPAPELLASAETTAAANGETVTDVLNRALEDYVKGKP